MSVSAAAAAKAAAILSAPLRAARTRRRAAALTCVRHGTAQRTDGRCLFLRSAVLRKSSGRVSVAGRRRARALRGTGRRGRRYKPAGKRRYRSRRRAHQVRFLCALFPQTGLVPFLFFKKGNLFYYKKRKCKTPIVVLHLRLFFHTETEEVFGLSVTLLGAKSSI